ncbi:MAG: PIN domain-containing protein [Acidobacteriota bacterium]|jgi:predicted nucleic acid-binding protein
MAKLVFIDAGVLIAAARGKNDVAERAMHILDDPALEFASSIFVKLEVLPKPLFLGMDDEAEFYETFFGAVSSWAEAQPTLAQQAYDEAVKRGLSAMDALHIAAAASVGADELITTEKQTKPIHRSQLISIRTILP